MGGNIIQRGDDKGGIQGGLGQAALNIPVNQPAQTAAQATAAAKAKEAEIAKRFPIQTGQEDVIISNVPGFDADDAKAARMQFQRENQVLNNLLIAEQQAKNREGIIRAAQQDQLRKADLTGFEGGLFGLNVGATPSEGISGIATVRNPFTKEPLQTQIKAREGLTTPQYNQFIADLYDANPELYQETFPFASGQVASPIIVKALEAAKAAGSGIMGLPGVNELAQMGGDIVGAMISPLSGLFTGKTAKTGFVNPKAPTGGSGIVEAVPEGMNMNIYGSFIGKPGPFTADFIDQDGDGVDDRFQSGPGKPKAPPYSPPKQPAETIIPSQKLTPFDINAFYASLPQYTQQGIMNPNLMSYYQNLGMFPGMAV
jgi:hypothetical protein